MRYRSRARAAWLLAILQTTAFIDLPGGRHVTLAGGPHGTERTFAG